MRSIARISLVASAVLCVLGSTSCEARRLTETEAELTASVSVNPPLVALTVQSTVPLSAIAKNVTGAILPNRPITWSSANPSIATVSSEGNVTGLAVGVTTVSATSDGRSGTSAITVTPVPVSSVEVIPSGARLYIADALQLAAMAKDASNTPLSERAMSWSSSHASIAKVTASGLVTAVAVGTAYIIATSEGKSDTSAIEIMERPVASVAVAPATATVEEGAVVQLSATMRDANGTVLTGRVVTWASSNTGAATVSSTGMVTGVAQGSTTISATSEGASATADITVVPPPPLVVDAGADQTIALGTAAALNATVTNRGPGPLKMFWSKISGPGTAVFSHEQFTSSFEDGTISEWTAPTPDLPDRVGGHQNGGGYVTQDMAHSGAYSWKGYNDPSLPPPENFSAKLLRWRFDWLEGYYSAWYWWPPERNVTLHEPINVFQFKERTSPYNPSWLVHAKLVNGRDILELWDWYGHVGYKNPAAVLPKGRWFHIAAYQKVSRTAGELTVWLDGVRIYDLSGINTLGGATNTSPPFLMWGVGNYAPLGTSGIGTHLYVDDAAGSNVTDPRNTSVRFSAPGTYLVRLTASNGATTLSDTVEVTVR